MKSDEYHVDEWQSLDAQARAWLVRLKSGEATRNDLNALARWRASSAQHESAFHMAVKMWNAMGATLAGPPRAVPVTQPRTPPVATPIAAVVAARGVSRRWVLGGATGLAASVALGGIMIGSSAPAGATVYETRKGERRRFRPGAGLDLELNTDSRVYFWPGPAPRLTLDRGEAMISVARSDGAPLLVKANLVEVSARQARFIMRDHGEVTRIACLEGDVSIRSEGRAYTLTSQRSLALGESLLAPVEAAAQDSEAAWQRGLFVFKNRPAGDVVAELNRYRSGHVYLPGDRSATRISGVIHLDRVDMAVDHIARSLRLKAVRLPGGVVILRG